LVSCTPLSESGLRLASSNSSLYVQICCRSRSPKIVSESIGKLVSSTSKMSAPGANVPGCGVAVTMPTDCAFSPDARPGIVGIAV
jgi:hypothetical protein